MKERAKLVKAPKKNVKYEVSTRLHDVGKEEEGKADKI